MAVRKPAIYTLPHGIQVLGEYGPNARCPYWRVRIRPHPFFPNAKERFDAILVQRSRVIMASIIGRALEYNEHAHHVNGDRENDSPGNLELLSAAEHNRHHKIGARHTEEARAKISNGLRRAIAEGRREPPPRPNWVGRKHSDESRRKMSETRIKKIASGEIAKSIPPSPLGRKMSDEARKNMSEARREWWRRKRQAESMANEERAA